MDKSKDSPVDEKMSKLAENLRETLSPFEPTLMKVQSLLVWEKPAKSVIMFAGVHCIFW